MKKIGRNDPCSCGSGRKYKHCCLNETNISNEENLAGQLLGEVRDEIEGQEFHSLEEAQDFLNRLMEEKNRGPQSHFLGLSPEQMHRILYQPLEATMDIVEFNHALAPAAFWDIQVVKNCRMFLSRLGELEPLKATAKGNLPLNFARELYEEFVGPTPGYGMRIRSEEDAISVLSLRHILRMCGWIKKEKKHFKLTAKGRKILSDGFLPDHFFTLFKTFTRKFNWPFQDRYPNLWIIQGGFLFSLYLLRVKACGFVEAETLGDCFVEAFPMMVTEAQVIPGEDPVETVGRCFSLRFLERFCEYFGFLDVVRKKKVPYGQRLFVKTSDFFKNYFAWKTPQYIQTARHC